MHQLIRMTKTSSFLQSHLDIIADYIGTASAENAKTEIMANESILKCNVLVH